MTTRTLTKRTPSTPARVSPSSDRHLSTLEHADRPTDRFPPAQELIADGEDDGNGPDRTSRNHQRLDRRRREVDDRDAERIAADLKARHQQQQVQAYSGDNENLPQSLLVPSVEDPKLWQVRVKVRPLCPACEGIEWT